MALNADENSTYLHIFCYKACYNKNTFWFKYTLCHWFLVPNVLINKKDIFFLLIIGNPDIVSLYQCFLIYPLFKYQRIIQLLNNKFNATPQIASTSTITKASVMKTSLTINKILISSDTLYWLLRVPSPHPLPSNCGNRQTKLILTKRNKIHLPAYGQYVGTHRIIFRVFHWVLSSSHPLLGPVWLRSAYAGGGHLFNE